MKVRQTTPQPEYDAEQFDGVNVPHILRDKHGVASHNVRWVMPELKWQEAESIAMPEKRPTLEVTGYKIGTVKLAAGDWVLCDEIGLTEVWDDQSFRANFTPTDIDEQFKAEFIPALTRALAGRRETYSGGAV